MAKNVNSLKICACCGLGNLTTQQELLSIKYVLLTPDRIRLIRDALEMSREKLSNYFFVSPETIRNWERCNGKTTEIPGPAVRQMILLENAAVKKSNKAARMLREIIKNKQEELEGRFVYEKINRLP